MNLRKHTQKRQYMYPVFQFLSQMTSTTWVERNSKVMLHVLLLHQQKLTLYSIMTGSTHLSIVLDTTCSNRTLTNLQSIKCISDDHEQILRQGLQKSTCIRNVFISLFKPHSLFVRDESPEVDLKVVSINLHLLQSKLSKRSQSYTLQQSL